MRKILILAVSLITLISCSIINDSDTTEVNIRLSNVSQFDYQNIVVNTSTGNVNFENIDSGQYTNFKVFQKAYRYAFIQLEIEGETYTIQPIDYFGEETLKNGYYTYQIDANDSQDQFGRLSLVLIKE